jgi:energy-coupling factor transport system ATP-binding protein
VRDARRAAGTLRARLRALPAPPDPVDPPSASVSTPAAVQVSDVVAGYRSVPVLRGVDLQVSPGEVVALMGRNGAGKSTLLATMAGMRAPDSGTVRVAAADPRTLTGATLLRTVGLVPQEPADLLYATTVGGECADADTSAGVTAGTAAGLLALLSPGIDPAAHPRDLSEGQRLALALAVVLAAAPPVLLLDEPTRGLDYGAKRRLVALLGSLRESGHSVIMATHDVELVAEVATRVAVIADGEIVADGGTGGVVRSSPLFAPQVAKILTPEPWLTVGQVEHALAASG